MTAPARLASSQCRASRPRLVGAALVAVLGGLLAGAGCIGNPPRPAEIGPPATSIVPPSLNPGLTPGPSPSPRIFGPVPSPAASPSPSPTPTRAP